MFFLTVHFAFAGAVLLSQKSDLDYITFKWNKMTAIEFEEQWKLKEITKKIDFIHMIQVSAGDNLKRTSIVWYLLFH